MSFRKPFDTGLVESVGAEKSGFRRDQDRFDSEPVGNVTGVERAGSPEREQRILGRICSVADRDGPDRIGHLLDCDFEETFEKGGIELLARNSRLLLQGDRCGACRFHVFHRQGDAEVLRIDPTEKKVHIGDGERTTTPIAGRPGIGAGGLGADMEAPVLPLADGSASRCDRFDLQGGGEQSSVSHDLLEAVLEATIVAGHVRAGATHVEGEDSGETELFGDGRGTGNATGRTGEERVLRVIAFDRFETTGRGHREERAGFLDAGFDVGEKGLHHRMQVAVGDRGLSSREQLDQGSEVGADRYVVESQVEQSIAKGVLVNRIAISVEQGHRRDADSLVDQGTRFTLELVLEPNGGKDGSVGGETFVDADDCGKERGGALVIQGEQVLPPLIPQDEKILETTSRKVGDGGALPFEEGVRSTGCREAELEFGEGLVEGGAGQQSSSQDRCFLPG